METTDIERSSTAGTGEDGDAELRGSAGRKKLIERVAETEPKDLTDDDQADALEWLLGSFHETEPPTEDRLTVNVGTPQHPKKIEWVIAPVDGAVIRKIRDQAANARVARRGGAAGLVANAEAQFTASVRVVVAGTVKPDLAEGAKQVGVPTETFLEMALNRKQGLIDQLSAEIMAISGYDDDDVQDATAARAAGNS